MGTFALTPLVVHTRLYDCASKHRPATQRFATIINQAIEDFSYPLKNKLYYGSKESYRGWIPKHAWGTLSCFLKGIPLNSKHL